MLPLRRWLAYAFRPGPTRKIFDREPAATITVSRQNSRSLNYAKTAKTGFLVGVGLFAAGAVGEFAGHSLVSSLPETVGSVLFAMEVLGVVIGFFAPIVFGAVLPLAE